MSGALVIERPARVEAAPGESLWHRFPGYERARDPSPPVGAVAYCGYVCKGLGAVTVAPGVVLSEDCHVCMDMAASS